MLQHHPVFIAAGTNCPCGLVCPLCGTGRHDLISVGVCHDQTGKPVEHSFLYCLGCGLEYSEDLTRVRYADGDAPYRRVRELLTSIETVAMAQNHVVTWRGPVARCERCGAVDDANDAEAYLNGYPAVAFTLARPCTKRP